MKHFTNRNTAFTGDAWAQVIIICDLCGFESKPQAQDQSLPDGWAHRKSTRSSITQVSLHGLDVCPRHNPQSC